MTRYALFLFLGLSMANLSTHAAQDEDDYIRIARISYMEGNVSFQHTSDVDWTAATVNLPLQPGDRIYTGPQGKAEIQFDEGSVYRLAAGTDIQFLSLREDLIQIRIMTGLSSLTASGNTTFEMDTPAAAFIVLRPGLYRFETRDNGDTDAIVRKGELETVSHRFVRRVGSGEKIFVTADENSSYNIARYSGRDAWDEWNDRRDADFVARTSRGYLPDYVYVGVSDLDRYGRWVNVESYGAAWIPFSVSVSWSPYSVGRWCYRPVWGWTWVSYEPWGWLPYHYGRWYRSPRFGWCWLPGPSFSFNFWSPGLVTFYYGPSWVSWCPLGPGDYYSINNYYYNRRLHHRHLAQLRPLHRRAPGDSINRHVRGAFHTVDKDHFRNGGSRAVATKDGYRRVDRPWDRGTLVRERLAVQPSKRSFSADPDRQVVPSRLLNPRPAVVQNTPSARAASRSGYTRIKNPEVTSRAVSRSRNETVSKPDNTDRRSDSGSVRVLSNPKKPSIGSAKARSDGSTNSINQVGRPVVRSDDRGNSVVGDSGARNTVRSSEKRSETRSYFNGNDTGGKDRTVTDRLAVPRISVEKSSRENSGSRTTNSRTQSSPSIRRIQPSQQPSASAERESVRSDRSSGQSGVSRSSNSTSRTRSYSTSSSSSRARSYSPPSSSSGNRSYSAPSSSSRTRSYSAPSSSSRSRSYSSPSSSSRAQSYKAPSSGRGSAVRSSSPSSSGKSSSGNSGGSGTRAAKRRN